MQSLSRAVGKGTELDKGRKASALSQAAVRAMKAASKDNIINGVQMRKTGVPCTQQGLYWSDQVAAAAKQ